MNNKETRWHQRFQNFTNSLEALNRAVDIEEPSETEKGGVIKFYEVTFELAWKTLKDYLESEGFILKSPRETIKQAFQMEIIVNGEEWLEALDDRNLTSHIYDNEVANQVVDKIKNKYFVQLKELHSYLLLKRNG